MKKLFLFLLLGNLLLPSYAHFKGIKTSFERTRIGKIVIKRPSVSDLSRRVNEIFYNKIRRISTNAIGPSHQSLARETSFHTTFLLRYNDHPLLPVRKEASGFAIALKDKNGNEKIWGVTAGHVARNISTHKKARNRSPHIRIQTDTGAFVVAPIEKIFVGNPEGMDIALFEIPQEALPYVTVLQAAEYAPVVGEKVTIQGFLAEQGAPFSLTDQTVLLSTSSKIFLKKTPLEDMTGFCGSPGFTNGRVSMVYIGFNSGQVLAQNAAWFHKLSPKIQAAMSGGLHYAIPINIVKLMAKSIEETGSLNEGGMMMRVFGHPVVLLHPNESIVFIEQVRNGEIISKIEGSKYSPINPEHLELFFDLQKNDILRVSLDSFSLEHPFPAVSIVHDINVSTGKVTTTFL